MRAMVRAAVAPLALLLASPALGQAKDADVAGHYYLQGEMETGSELLLNPDGGYRWYLSVGALDLTSEGTWRREGERLVLSPTPRASGPVLTATPPEPWGGEAAKTYAERAFAAAWDQAEDRCHFLARFANNAPEPIPPDAPLADPAAERERVAAMRASAARTWQEAHGTVAELDRAVAALNLLTPAAPGWQAAVDRVYRAYDLYENAHLNAIALYQRTGDIAPKFPDYPPPATCAAPVRQGFVANPAPHVAVHLTAVGTGKPLGNLLIHARHADGSEPEPVAAKRGWAFVPLPPGATLTQLWLGTDGAPIADAAALTVPVKLSAPATVQIAADITRLAPPPFETMTLTVTAAGLRGDMFRQGRYVRQR